MVWGGVGRKGIAKGMPRVRVLNECKLHSLFALLLFTGAGVDELLIWSPLGLTLHLHLHSLGRWHHPTHPHARRPPTPIPQWCCPARTWS